MTSEDLSVLADDYLARSEATMQLLRETSNPVSEIALVVSQCLLAGGKVLWFGNGGSAADAQHLACELVGRFRRDRRALSSMALTTDSSILTALGNDYGFDTIFSRQVEAMCQKGDVAVGITTSGESPNVLKGLEQAHIVGATTVALTGKEGSSVDSYADWVIHVPVDETCHIQEGHIAIGQLLCLLIEVHLGIHD